jgi:oxalate decarboxylase/phosphoglucose isomerase-like protein (cupin superfamily)
MAVTVKTKDRKAGPHQVGSCYIVYGHDVETLSFDWGNVKLLSSPDVAGGDTMTFGMVVLEPGKGHARHNHPDADEILFIISGEGEQMLDDEEPVPIRPGASIYVPRGVFHSTLNTGWEPLRFVVVYAPAGTEKVLRELPDVTIVPPGRLP